MCAGDRKGERGDVDKTKKQKKKSSNCQSEMGSYLKLLGIFVCLICNFIACIQKWCIRNSLN